MSNCWLVTVTNPLLQTVMRSRTHCPSWLQIPRCHMTNYFRKHQAPQVLWKSPSQDQPARPPKVGAASPSDALGVPSGVRMQ